MGYTRKAKWTARDRLLAQAWSIDRDAKCRGCGCYLDETVGVDGWHRHESFTCDGCRAIEKAQNDRKESQPGLKDYAVKIED